MGKTVERKALNTNLRRANQIKNDEFYTQLADIENELKHYKDQFHGKVVFLNCDDPYESNFFKYFAGNFKHLRLKKLIATSYAGSPIVGTQLPFPFMASDGKQPFKIEINDVPDADGDGAIDLTDVQHLLKHDKNIATPIRGDGDFRSEECTKLLKEADIVCTNPPFSLFREYVTQLVEYNKKFLIIGSKNAITYKEIFKLIKENKLWMGYGFSGGNAYFKTPNVREFASGVYDEKTGLVKFRNVGWFTNMDFDKRHEKLQLYKQYNPIEYQKYDNYDAIEVSKVADIPMNYKDAMGVPITFLDKYNPEQFEILGLANDKREIDKAFIQGSEFNLDEQHKRFVGMVLNKKATYARILIKQKDI
jgi:hypothetical protein